VTAAAASRSADLSREECMRLLGAGSVGRVVVLTPAGTPVIRPVNYAFDGASRSVVFRCQEGTKLISLLRAPHAWFEVDEIDPAGRTGWSVIISGVTEAVTRPEEVRRLEELALDTWAVSAAARWFRIRARVVSGRRIGSSVPVTEPHE
jgi:nitroimidazol reductase NimA-like FMN-containing flavoprotein (pyridoxamine 5'-phosphate oxidase superfamily)